MLDEHTQRIVQSVLRSAAGLYRARPYTKSVPFRVTAATADVLPLWTPQNAYFEFNRMMILSDTASIDLNIVDTNVFQVLGMVVPDTAFYTLVDFGPAGYRSTLASNAVLGLVDPTASGAIFKGVVLGWEVTPDGNYR